MRNIVDDEFYFSFCEDEIKLNQTILSMLTFPLRASIKPHVVGMYTHIFLGKSK